MGENLSSEDGLVLVTCVGITYSKQHNKARKDLLRRGAAFRRAHPFTRLRLG